MNVLIVTGTPGTGKTTLSVKLAEKLDFYYIDVNKIVRKHKLSERYDRKRKTKVVDVKKLNRALIKEISNYKELIQSITKLPNVKKSIKNQKIINNKIKTRKQRKSMISVDLKNESFSNNQRFFVSRKFNEFSRKIKKGIIIDSHLSHYLPKRYVDLCIVVKCDLKELEKRLRKKKYSKEKVRENLDAEIFDICLNEAEAYGHKIIVIDATEGLNIEPLSRKIK
jgi:broad-specificity NMP kinase